MSVACGIFPAEADPFEERLGASRAGRRRDDSPRPAVEEQHDEETVVYSEARGAVARSAAAQRGGSRSCRRGLSRAPDTSRSRPLPRISTATAALPPARLPSRSRNSRPSGEDSRLLTNSAGQVAVRATRREGTPWTIDVQAGHGSTRRHIQPRRRRVRGRRERRASSVEPQADPAQELALPQRTGPAGAAPSSKRKVRWTKR